MAYSASNLDLVAGRRGRDAPRVWSYKSADAVTDVRAANYIANARDMGMRAGDVVYVTEVNASTGAVEAVHICVALTVDADGADLTDGLAITMTNT